MGNGVVEIIVCVCVYLVQVCLAACAESPLAWVSPSGPPHLLLESAEQHKPPCFYLFFCLFVFSSVDRPVLPSGPVYLSDCGETGQRSQTAAVSDHQGLRQQAGGRVLRRVRLVHCSDNMVLDYGSLAGTRCFYK